MDAGSSLIFIGLAVAWAVYLLPVALRHHHESDRSRVVDTFSRRMRVLAHRAPVDSRTTELVTPGQPATSVTTGPAPSPAARRAAAKRATKRRRNVLALILLATAAVTGVAAFGLISWWYVAIPAGLLVAWLVACRIMVKGERKAMAPAARMPLVDPAEKETVEEAPQTTDRVEAEAEVEVDPMADTSAGMAAVVDPALWDPVPVTLPTYVTKPAATRTVRTIAFDDTGVWTSGRTDADAQIAREADEADKAARKSRDEGERATGS